MAILKKYIPAKHDIFTYTPTPTLQPLVGGNPVARNPLCQGTSIDWSGISIRQRTFCTVAPIVADWTAPFEVGNIDFYNGCNPCVVLITPKHALVCQHYRGTFPRTGEYYTYLGKSGVVHKRFVSAVTLDIGADHTLLEFAEAFPEDVSVYDHIADIKYIPTGTILWNFDSNGKCYQTKFGTAVLNSQGNGQSFTFTPVLDGVNDGIKPNGNMGIFVGDSGSPAFVKDARGNTILVGLMYGGMQINTVELAAINTKTITSGYTVKHVKIFAKMEDVNQDGVVDGTDMGMVGNGDRFIDMNNDGKIDGSDLGKVLAAWGP